MEGRLNFIIIKKVVAFLPVTAFILGLLFLGSCGIMKKSSKKEEIPCTDMNRLQTTFKTDPFTLDSVWIDENCLNLVVRYDGGCGEANCDLFYTGKVRQSFPPKTTLWIRFTDNDPCRSEVTKHFRFKLTPFEKYAVSGGIQLDFAATRKQVLYKTGGD